MATSTGLMTFEEFERLPEEYFEVGKCELLEGELLRMPPAFIRHTKGTERMYKASLRYWEVGNVPAEFGEPHMEAGYQLDVISWLQPDVSITHRDQPEGKYIQGAPALAVEIISASNTIQEMRRKLGLYLAHGAREVWFVYPDELSIEVHRPGIAIEQKGVFAPELLPGLSIDIASL